MNSLLNNKNLQIAFLITSSLLIFLGRQLDTGITNFDDAYYAQKAKEILDSGAYWIITQAGEPALDNPPLPFWLTAFAYSIFGVSSYAAIFPSALFAVGIVLMTYRLSLWLYKETWIAFAAAFILLFPGIFIDASRRAMVDIPLAFFVTLAFYAVFKAKEVKSWYLIFGFATAGAILTKSVLGLFPVAITGAFLILSRQWKEIINPWFISGSLIALTFGFSWHFVNWQHFGQEFIDVHFGLLIFNRGFGEEADSFYILGYASDFLKNYWPWLPLALVGLIQFGKRGFIEKDPTSLLLFLWPVLAFLVMSTSKNHTIRYLLMIFPALAIVIAKTVATWFDTGKRNRALTIMVVVTTLTVLFVNATPFQAKVTLGQSSKEVRELAAIINLNTPENQKIGNYHLSQWNPKHAVLFYSNRILEKAVVAKPEVLLNELSAMPGKTWLTSIGEFRNLNRQYPNTVHLIQANNKFAFFTAAENKKNISYDFSGLKLPIVK
ncbi:MAG: glycosyltransferase family 39 protein [Nitrospinaceae bacterium]|nr:glycosyltransferase family 39 protein [Nitrospinaceae bacterium]